MTPSPANGRRRRLAAAIAALAVPATTLALAQAPAANADDNADSLIVARAQSIDSLNPYFNRNVIDFDTIHLTYESLVRRSAEDFGFEPSLATEWEASDDGLTWTFTIRDDSEWSDGEPVTAEDVEYTYSLLLENEEINARHFDFASKLESVEATDEHTFVVHVKEPTPQVLSIQYPIIPKHIWENVDDPATYANDEAPLVGSGPYIMVEQATDEFIRFEANENYWDGAPEFDELVFRHYSSPDAEVSAIQSGEVDVVGYGSLTPAQYKALEGQEGITVNAGQNRRFVSVIFNVGAQTKDGKPFGDGHPALKDPVVRQAMHHAIDKEELVERVLDGFGDPGVGPIPKIFDSLFWEPEGDEMVEFNIEEANQMLDDAGYERGSDGTRMMPDGSQPLSFRLYQHADNASYASATEFLEGWWSELGIEIKTETIEQGPLNDLDYLGEYDIAYSGWGIDPDPDFLALHSCEGLPTVTDGTERAHETFYCNPEYDTLQEQQTREIDEEARADLIKQQQEILYNDAPQIYLWYQDQLEAYRSDKVENLTLQPTEGGLLTGQTSFLWSFYNARPVGSGGGGGTGATVAIAAGAVVMVGAAAIGLVTYRRRQTAEERE